MYHVEVGMGKGKYECKLSTHNRTQAWAVYYGYHVHSGGKKRLVWAKPGRRLVKARVITSKFS